MLPFLKRVREARRPRCTALVAAAGSSERMVGVNKLLQPLGGVPVLVRYGETTVLVNATASKKPRDGIDFLPLSVDFE